MGPGPAKAFGKPNHTDGHGGDIGQFEKTVGFLIEPHDLGASPANIKNDDMIGMIFKQRPAPDGCQFGFRRPVDNFEAQARFFAHRLMKFSPFSALRHASVATQRTRATPALRILLAHIDNADSVRDIAPSDKIPSLSNPSPKRTMRENESRTRKLLRVASTISRRQLFVPKSIAA